MGCILPLWRAKVFKRWGFVVLVGVLRFYDSAFIDVGRCRTFVL